MVTNDEKKINARDMYFWAETQKEQYRYGYLDNEKIRMLEEIKDWTWESDTRPVQIEMERQFKLWLIKQMRFKRDGALTKDQIEAVEELMGDDFDWSLPEDDREQEKDEWEVMKEYRKEMNKLKTDYKLLSWEISHLMNFENWYFKTPEKNLYWNDVEMTGWGRTDEPEIKRIPTSREVELEKKDD